MNVFPSFSVFHIMQFVSHFGIKNNKTSQNLIA